MTSRIPWPTPTLCLALSCLASACDPDGLGRAMPNFLVIGHHGAPNEIAENTIPSMARAISDGANAVEIDVCVTKDDVIVLWHDRDPDDAVSLARQVDGQGLLYVPSVPEIGSVWRRPVPELTLDELRAHYGYAKFGQSQDSSAVIATLDEFLDWARGEKKLKAVYVDSKMVASEVGHLVPLIERISSDDALSHVRFVFLSTDNDMVMTLEAERKRLGVDSPRVAFDSEQPGALDTTIADGLRDLSIGLTPSRTWSGLKVEVSDAVNARDAGQVDSVMVWTIDRETELGELLYYSVDGIITDEPTLLFKMWQETLSQ